MLKRATIRVLQREKELEYQLYDGSKTLNIIVPDVRVGDVLEYHFSLEGANPVFAGSFQDIVDLQWAVPVGQIQYRLLWPSARKLFIRQHGIELAAAIRDQGALTEYRWSREDIPPLSADADHPGWYDPYPWIQLSESPNWNDVARWAQGLFDPNGDEAKNPALHAAVNRITTATTPEQRVLDILRFVQEDIRYLGIEIGAYSHTPNRPEAVLERRFGDCKDKTRLMVGLLRASGIEAWPALVHTGIRRGLANYHPTKAGFNHAIVHARVNGKLYWLDPTLKYQKGTLDTLSQPSYEKALVVSNQTTALTDMDVSAQTHAKFAQETIDLRKPRDKPAVFTVATVYERYFADSMRQSLGTQSHDEIQKTYTNYYVKAYPGIRSAKRFEVEEDNRQNRLTMTEHYEVRDIWVKSTDAKAESENVAFYPYLLLDTIKRPESPLRSMPLNVSHPVHYRHTTTVLLPDNWSIKDSVETVNDEAFVFQRRIAYHNKTLTLDYDYRSLRDSVDAKQTARYVANIARVRDMLGYEIFQPSAASLAEPKAQTKGNDMNWLILAMLLMAAVIWVTVAWWVYRYDPSYVPNHPVDSDLVGIRGWLILPGIGLTLTPLRVLFEQRDLLYVFSAQRWSYILGAEGASPFLGLMIVTELIFNIGLIVMGIVLTMLFFQKRHTLPRLYILYSVAASVFLVSDLILAPLVLGDRGQPAYKEITDTIRSVISLMLWVWYFSVSKRVRATFTRRHHA